MAHHYGTAVLPARPRRPRDKSKVEVAVQIATRWVIAKLRNRHFFSLVELNAAIRELVTQLNDRVTRHLGTSRVRCPWPTRISPHELAARLMQLGFREVDHLTPQEPNARYFSGRRDGLQAPHVAQLISAAS
jgi:O-methyltransferase involved in polyketide biosynthesis